MKSSIIYEFRIDHTKDNFDNIIKGLASACKKNSTNKIKYKATALYERYVGKEPHILIRINEIKL